MISVSKKYITSIAWSSLNNFLMAIASHDNHISLVEQRSDEFAEIGRLTGHTGSVTSVEWCKQTTNFLVSASFDHSVRVWNADTLACIAWMEYDNRMQCAIFLPTG